MFLAASVAVAVVSLGIRNRFGVPAVSAASSDFDIASAHSEITHETATACRGDLGILNYFSGGGGNTTASNSTDSVVSCVDASEFLDSFDLNAKLNLDDNDFGTDLSSEPISVKLAPASCDSLASNPNPAGTFVAELPGNSFMVHSNPNKTIYTFEGNVAGTIFVPYVTPGRRILGSSVSMEVTVPDTGTEAYFHLEGNGSLCAFESGGNASLTITMGSLRFPSENETAENETEDTSCIDITPEFETKDVSQSVCPVIPVP